MNKTTSVKKRQFFILVSIKDFFERKEANLKAKKNDKRQELSCGCVLNYQKNLLILV